MGSSADGGDTHSMWVSPTTRRQSPAARQNLPVVRMGSCRTQSAAQQVGSTQHGQLQWGLGQHADCSIHSQS